MVAPPDAAVDIDLGAVADGVDDLGQGTGRRDHVVELATAVVRHRDRRRSRFDAPRRVVAP